MTQPQWIASFPTFGDWHIKLFREFGAPTVKVALDELAPEDRPTLVIHTDQHGCADNLGLGPIEYRPVDGAKLGLIGTNNSHREAIRSSQQGAWVSCLQADFIVSRNFFSRIREHMLNGKHAVIAHGVRGIADGRKVPIGASPRALLEWVWDNRHYIIKQLEPGGDGAMPGILYFPEGNSVVAHAIHVHPLVFINNGKVNVQFTHEVGSTETLLAYNYDDIHQVTDPDDVSYCDLLEVERTQPSLGHPWTPEFVAEYLKPWGTPLNRWQWKHRMVIKGTADEVHEMPVIDKIMQLWE